MQHNGHRKPAGARVAKDQLCLLRCDHAIDVADLILRKPAYPNPAKPRSIIAQVERPQIQSIPTTKRLQAQCLGYRPSVTVGYIANNWVLIFGIPAQWM
jgi:hypothetical protein